MGGKKLYFNENRLLFRREWMKHDIYVLSFVIMYAMTHTNYSGVQHLQEHGSLPFSIKAFERQYMVCCWCKYCFFFVKRDFIKFSSGNTSSVGSLYQSSVVNLHSANQIHARSCMQSRQWLIRKAFKANPTKHRKKKTAQNERQIGQRVITSRAGMTHFQVIHQTLRPQIRPPANENFHEFAG